MNDEQRIPISFDKRHIITLGRRMYKESIDLIRELVNNAYDADASRVDIDLTPKIIRVTDNGSGMNMEELHLYFKVGSEHKKETGRSKRFGRKLIGEMGIGKFSSLGATARFEVITKKGNFKARVVFDQQKWQTDESTWTVPCTQLEPIDGENAGTQITLFDIEQHFTPQEVADRIRTTVPLDAENFDVYINGKKIEPIFIQGRRFSIDIQSKYGLITGELILANKALPFSEIGIVCCVKDVMITRSLFGFEDYGHGTRRITGKINADFLQFTSDRNDFLIKTSEYREFHKIIREEVRKLIKLVKSQEDEKLIAQSRRALSKATRIIRKAFQQVPELVKKMEVVVSRSHTGASNLEDIVSHTWREKKPKSKTHPPKKPITKRGEYKIAHVNPVTESKILKKIKTDLGFNFGFVNEGENGPPSYFYANTVYVNRQHSLYQKLSKTLEEETNHLVRILIAEAIMLTDPADFRQYYERQIKVLLMAYS
ncbi:MAG: ATP-binding protein [Bacteroidetes bacterium]|nr:ATP-binding protein [Bacteroidota bacterium]